MPKKSVVMYSAELCGDCQNLKSWLDLSGIGYELRDIRKQPEHGVELEAKTGKLGVPFLILDGEWKRGYDPGKPFSESFARELFGV